MSIDGEGSESEAAVQVYSPFGLFNPGTFSLPSSARNTVLENLGFASVGDFQQYSLNVIKDLGVSWVRMEFEYDGWNFIESPAYLESLHASGVEIMGTVTPLGRDVPADLSKFQDDFRQLIGRYPWIKVWQIGNEPDLSLDHPEEQYPPFFMAGQKVVRSACPDCRVALAGTGGRWPGQDAEGWAHSLEVYDRIIGDIADQNPGDQKPFDIIDMHFYDFYRTVSGMQLTLREYSAIPGRHGLADGSMEFWVTESATPTGQVVWPAGSPTQTEDEQASELVTRFVTMLGAQVKRLAWARFFENYRYSDMEDGFFDHTGLIYNGLGTEADQGIQPGTKKKAYYAYQLLTEKVNDCSRVARLGDGKYLFFFADEDRAPVYVLWSAGGTEPPDNLTGPATVTDLDGNVIELNGEDIVLGPSPIFVEKL